ncbi:MAG: hypothetical protein QXE01_01460 [Sulfolobales archaeon]
MTDRSNAEYLPIHRVEEGDQYLFRRVEEGLAGDYLDLSDKRVLIIGAGSCGRAVSILISDLMDVEPYYYDIDPSKDLAIGRRANGVSGFDIYHICVPEDAVPSVVKKIPEGSYVVIHSTMPPGSTRGLGRDVIYMPLFFRERHVEDDLRSPGRIVIGTRDGRCPSGWGYILAYRWARKSGAEIYCLGYEEAELVKLGTNALRAVAIAFYNELYMIARRFGADYRKVFEILSPSDILDRLEGGMWGRKPELAGRPFNGKCLPKDLAHLARVSPLRSSILKTALASNEELEDDSRDYRAI